MMAASHKHQCCTCMRRLLLQLNEECQGPLDKYELLTQIAATNVSLLYYVLIDHLADLAPIVYTPTVGEACQKFDRIYRCAPACSLRSA